MPRHGSQRSPERFSRSHGHEPGGQPRGRLKSGAIARAAESDQRESAGAELTGSVRERPGGSLVRMQRLVGNASVNRLIDDGGPRTLSAPIQRYAVGVANDAECHEALAWMNSSNPHLPNWALTKVHYTHSESTKASGGPPNWKVKVINPAVTISGTDVDMPQWAPTDPDTAKAWGAMITVLRAHEKEHEQIGKDWKPKLQTKLGGVVVDVTADTEADALNAAGPLISEQWDTFIGEANTAQGGIDPFTAPLICPAAKKTAEESGDGGTDEGLLSSEDESSEQSSGGGMVDDLIGYAGDIWSGLTGDDSDTAGEGGLKSDGGGQTSVASAEGDSSDSSVATAEEAAPEEESWVDSVSDWFSSDDEESA